MYAARFVPVRKTGSNHPAERMAKVYGFKVFKISVAWRPNDKS